MSDTLESLRAEWYGTDWLDEDHDYSDLQMFVARLFATLEAAERDRASLMQTVGNFEIGQTDRHRRDVETNGELERLRQQIAALREALEDEHGNTLALKARWQAMHDKIESLQTRVTELRSALTILSACPEVAPFARRVLEETKP